MIWPKHVTAFLCASIAADGSIGNSRVSIIKTSELERAEEVRDVLRDEGLRMTISKAGFGSFNRRQAYHVRLLYHGGQWATLYWSIKYWGMEKWLGLYKLKRLEKMIDLGVSTLDLGHTCDKVGPHEEKAAG